MSKLDGCTHGLLLTMLFLSFFTGLAYWGITGALFSATPSLLPTIPGLWFLDWLLMGIICIPPVLALFVTVIRCRCGLLTYAVYGWTSILFQLTCVTLLLTGIFNKGLQARVQTVIDNEYGGINGTANASVAFNQIMMTYNCCGIHSYEDFQTATRWDRHPPPAYLPTGYNGTMVSPVACCKIHNYEPVDIACVTDPNDDNSYWKTGCWQKLVDDVKKSQATFFALVACVVTSQVLCASLATCLGVRTKDCFIKRDYWHCLR